MWTLRFLFRRRIFMRKSIIAIAALAVSGVAYFIASRADDKATEAEKIVNSAVKDLSGMSSRVMSDRVSDGLINEAIKRAADKRVAQITKSISNDVRSEVESRVERMVQSAFDKARSDLNIADMVRRKAKEIVRGLDGDDLSKNLADEIKEAVFDEMKSQVKKKFTDSIF